MQYVHVIAHSILRILNGVDVVTDSSDHVTQALGAKRELSGQ